MRTYWKIYSGGSSANSNYVWTVLQTSASGDNSLVWFATLVQTLQLNLNESPFYATYGLPAIQSVMQQVSPDYYVALTQQLYAPYFLSLTITKQTVTATTSQVPNPTYAVNCITNAGVNLSALVGAQGYLVDGAGGAIVLGSGAEILV